MDDLLPKWGTLAFEVLAYRLIEPDLSPAEVGFQLGHHRWQIEAQMLRLSQLGLLTVAGHWTYKGREHYKTVAHREYKLNGWLNLEPLERIA